MLSHVLMCRCIYVTVTLQRTKFSDFNQFAVKNPQVEMSGSVVVVHNKSAATYDS